MARRGSATSKARSRLESSRRFISGSGPWVVLARDGEEAYAIVPADRRFAVFPTVFMFSKLKARAGENTVQLLFDLLAAGDVPDSPPGSYTLLN